MEISQKIVDYAIWYYLKYYPSPKKLTQKLIEKFGEKSENWKKYWWIWQIEIDYILTEKLRNIIQEEEVIQSKIRTFKNKWKSKLYIKQKLFERQEDKNLIEQFMQEAFLDGEYELVKKEYEKIKNKLNLNNVENLPNTRLEQQKIIEKLLRKWFKYDDVKKVMS